MPSCYKADAIHISRRMRHHRVPKQGEEIMRTHSALFVLALQLSLLVCPSLVTAQPSTGTNSRRVFSEAEAQALMRDHLNPAIGQAEFWAAKDHTRASLIRLAQFVLSSVA